MAKSLALFVLAGLAEIGEGYLVWPWLRQSKALEPGILGGLILFVHGVIPTFQSEGVFGHIYAA